jgi:hypothetical protein
VFSLARTGLRDYHGHGMIEAFGGRVMRWAIVLGGSILVASASVSAGGDVKETKSALETDPTGWIDLLVGTDLKHWKRVPIPPGSKLSAKNPWKLARTPDLTCEAVGIHEMLLFDKEFGDGIFHVEWRFQPVEGKKGYNSGVYVRNSADGAIWHQAQVGNKNVGYLFGQTLDRDGKKAGFNSKAIGAQRGKEAGEWNTYEITCKGKTVTLWVNGAVTTEWTACEVPRGYVGLEAEGWVIEFKNVKFKEFK